MTKYYENRPVKKRERTEGKFYIGDVVCAKEGTEGIFDDVLTGDRYGVITEADRSGNRYSIEWEYGYEGKDCLKTAWWDKKDLELIQPTTILVGRY